MTANQPEPTARDREVAANVILQARLLPPALSEGQREQLMDNIVIALATVRAEEREHLATEALAKHERDEVEPMWSEVAAFIRRGDAAEPGTGGGRG